VAFVCAAATAATRQTNIDVNVILGTTQYRQNPYGELEAIRGQKEGQYLKKDYSIPADLSWKNAAPCGAYASKNRAVGPFL
jgi:hypothetical protein